MGDLIPQNATIGDDNTISSMSTSDLANLIQQHEGWTPGSRSFRNNNPGNMKVHGDLGVDEGGFGVFSSPDKGTQALQGQISSFQQRFPHWSPTNLAARWLGSNTGDPTQVNPKEGNVSDYGEALTPHKTSPAAPVPQQPAPQPSPEAIPQGAQIGEPIPAGATSQAEAIPQGAKVGEPETTMDKVKKYGGAVWQGVSQPLIDNFTSTPGATKGYITKGLAKIEGANPDTFAQDHPVQDAAAGVGAGLTSPLGLALAASGVEGVSSLGEAGAGELLPMLGKKILKAGGLGLRGLGGEEVGRYVGEKFGMPGTGAVVGGIVGAGGLKEALGLGEEGAEAGAAAKVGEEAGASTKAAEAEAFQPKPLPQEWKMSGEPDNTRIPQQEWFPPTPANSDPNAAARKTFFGADETHPFNPPAEVAGPRGLNFNPQTSETPLMRSTAQNPANVTYANNPEELQAAFNRQQNYINGEKMMGAIGNNADLAKQVRDIVGMTNPSNPAAPSLQKAIRNLTGENWVISSRKTLQEVANARIEGFNHLLSKGFTPQQIVDASR